MHVLGASTDLSPEPFSVAIDTKNFAICKTLISLDDKNITNSLRKLVNNKCRFEDYLTQDVPEVTAAMFSK